jgi:hypothetical protein
MNRLLVASVLTLGLAAAAQATEQADVSTANGYEPVDHITALTRLYSFHVIDNDSLIVWRTPFDPYLIELRFPAHDLPFAWGIGITSTASRIDARFDSVQVRGMRYPIRQIYKLSRDQAKELSRKS